MSTTKPQERNFRKLSNVEHVRLRPGMWLGQNSESTYSQHFFEKEVGALKVVHEEITEIPAKMKCLDEAVMNCVDEYIKNLNDNSIAPKNKMTMISVELSNDCKRVAISDNGRGIPYNNAEGVFLHLMYGENFDDEVKRDRVAGQNGVGISLVRIVSNFFKVISHNGPNTYSKIFTFTPEFVAALKPLKFSKEKIAEMQRYFDEHGNVEKMELLSDAEKKSVTEIMQTQGLIAVLKKNTKELHGTKVEFELEPKIFNNLDLSFNPKLICQYLQDIAMTNPGLKLSFLHKKKTQEFLFKKGMDEFFKASGLEYYRMIYENPESNISLETFFVAGSGKSLTWVNSNFASLGGSPIEYLENRICDEIRKKPGIAVLEKKLKVPSTRNDVRNCFHIFNNLHMLQPRFKSQDKSYLINDINEEIRQAVDQHLDKIIKKLDLLNEVKRQMERRSHMKALDQAEKDLRKANRFSIPKLIPPTSKLRDGARILFIGEGDSAIAGLRPARDPKTHGLFPLRGKPLNVKGMPLAKAMANEEVKNLIAILGLPINEKIKSIEDLNYDKVSIITDADYDGYAIRSLMLSFFYEYWPELFTLNFVHYSSAPLYEVEVKNAENKVKLFYCIDDVEYDALMIKIKESGSTMVRKKRNKGLGETSKEAMRYAIESCITVVTIPDKKKAAYTQNLWFDKDEAAARRKVISEYAQLFFEA